jgi:DNA-directed RNA polymerase specialized sigma24 family protein
MEPHIIGFIRRKAGRWSRRIPGIDGDVDDLVQEGRCALMAAMPRYDPERPLHVYMGGVLDRCYAKILRDVLARKRTPHVDELDAETGEWRSVPCPTIPIDPATIQATTENDVEADLIRGELIAEITDLLYDQLTDVQAHVLDCYLSPEPELYFTARNLSGQYKPNARHIAMFLEIPVTQVEYALKKIKSEARAIIVRLSKGE